MGITAPLNIPNQSESADSELIEFQCILKFKIIYSIQGATLVRILAPEALIFCTFNLSNYLYI